MNPIVKKKLVLKKKVAKCSVCPQTEDNLVHMETPDKYHKAKLVCKICGKHIRWTQSYKKQWIQHKRSTTEKVDVTPKFWTDFEPAVKRYRVVRRKNS